MKPERNENVTTLEGWRTMMHILKRCLTIHGDLIWLQFQDLLLEELLLNITLKVMLTFGEPLKTHLHTSKHTMFELLLTEFWI